MRRYLLCAAISFLSCSPLLASTYQYTTLVGTGPDFFSGDALTQPFASEMVFQWEAESGSVFALDSQSESLMLLANLGMWADGGFSATGISWRDITVSLGGVSGQITIPTPVITANVPLSSIGVDQFAFNCDFGTISGMGTFSSISFALTFDNAGAGQLGVPFVSEDRTTATPYPPNFYVQGSNAGYLAVVVPGPSPVPEIDPNSLGSVLALVLGSLGLLERRRLKAA